MSESKTTTWWRVSRWSPPTPVPVTRHTDASVWVQAKDWGGQVRDRRHARSGSGFAYFATESEAWAWEVRRLEAREASLTREMEMVRAKLKTAREEGEG